MKKLFATLVVVTAIGGLLNCANQRKPVQVTHSLQSVYYDYDQSFIRSDATVPMQGNAGYLKQNGGVSVTIEGNCDNRGTNEYNMALGHRRAESAKNYLMNLGVGSSRMRVVSYGEEKPVCYQSNESCWQRNRRVDFRR